MTQSQEKIDAIYDLREAVATKVRMEAAVDQNATAQAREALLDATLAMEAKTQDAIEACHECGHSHADGTAHVVRRADNIIEVDFRPSEEAGRLR